MALDLVRYQRIQEVVVHRVECDAWTTTGRVTQVEPVVLLSEGWRARPCALCRPVFGVVTRERWRVASRGEQMLQRFGMKEGHRRVRLADVDMPLTPARADWKRHAGCRSSNPRLDGWLQWLFLTDTEMQWQVNMQKAVCHDCPVRAECLTEGVWAEEEWGVWGGATPRERHLLLKKWEREGRNERALQW